MARLQPEKRKRGRPAKAKAAEQVAEPATVEEPAPPVSITKEVQDKVHNFCPQCGSSRSRLVRSSPGPDGRMEQRKCKACLHVFNVWDRHWRP